MSAELVGIQRPQRWDTPFGPDMTDADVERVLTLAPFNQMDPERFSPSLPLRGILRNDARLVRCQRGDIVVRAGDYVSSAYFILNGTCRLELGGAGQRLPDSLLGRRPVERKSFFDVIAQLWRNHRAPEVRDPDRYRLDPRVGRRGEDLHTRIYLQDVQAVLDHERTAALQPGQSFGESAAMSRTAARLYTVFAETDTELLQIRWQGLRDLMRRDAALKQHAEKTFRERALLGLLTNAPLFRGLGPAELQAVADATVFESYGSYDKVSTFRDIARSDFAARLEKEPIIAEEGHYVNGLYMIRNGLVRVSVRHNNGQRTVSYLTPGQTYGLEELTANWHNNTSMPMRYTLRAVGYVNVIMVPSALIEKYVFEKKDVRPQPLPVVGADPGSDTDTGAAPPVKTDLLEFLVENRFISGTASMVIDLDCCTRCDDCVRACAATHDNNPRFLRHGPSYGNHMVANACMHCQDPVCMIECPTGAIHRDLERGNVIVNDQTCIGCGACAHNCPYDAIRMVEIRDALGNYIVDTKTNLPIVKATKCDLCIDQWGGPACQRACPHDALKRVDMRDVPALAQWLNR